MSENLLQRGISGKEEKAPLLQAGPVELNYAWKHSTPNTVGYHQDRDEPQEHEGQEV